jgi:5-methylcytosine-specific restriction endonuclease McrBC regulatory subunit McrC
MALASLAGMLPQWSSGDAYVAATLEAALLTWTLHAFADSLSRLIATGGLRNSHERVRRELDSRLRGRLLVGPWLRNVARGSPHLLPVEFPSLELDNQSNQTLRWALHVGILVARELPDTADLIDQLRREERHFTGVSLIRPAETALFLKGLPPNHRHYTEALQLARLVIANFHLGGKPGDLKGTAFALDMNQVYERAFFQGLRSIEPSAIRQAPWMVSLVPISPEDQGKGVVRTTRMLPDVLVPPDPVTGRVPVIMDTKWKAVMPNALSTDEEGDLLDPASRALVRVRPTDLYQATAYALEALQRNLGTAKESGGCLTALIYPTLVDVPDLGREIQIGESRILVRLVGWNVDRSPSDGIAAIWDRLCTTAEGRESSEHPDPRGRTP